MRGSATCKTGWSRREVHFDDVRNKDARNVSPVRLWRRTRTAKYNRIEEMSQFRVQRIFGEEFGVFGRIGAAVKILIGNRNEAFVKQRITLPGDLHPSAFFL